MKILHTADWHLGKRLDRFSRIEEQRAVMEEIVQITNELETSLTISPLIQMRLSYFTKHSNNFPVRENAL